MQKLKNKTLAILIAVVLTISMSASVTLIQKASAHSPAWDIPQYAYINAAPNPVGVGQTILVYMWLDSVYGAAGGGSEVVPGNASTASASLLANDYRFRNFELIITSPNGTSNTINFPIVSDPTSSQSYDFTPSQIGTYNLTFIFPGQIYGANGDGYQLSPLYGDYYEPANATTTLTVQSTAIPSPVTSEPLPANYWQEPIYGENTNWYAISSNWLGSASPTPGGYTSSSLYAGDNVGPLTAHIMWTTPIMDGGVVPGALFTNNLGVGFYEGSSYQPRYQNPIIMDGLLYYTEAISFTGSSGFGSDAAGPTVCVNLRTGQQIWSSTAVPSLSFGYIYYVYDPDQHGVFPPIVVAIVNGNWELFDGYTGDALFNVTGVPEAASLFGISISNVAAGPSGEQLIYNFANAGTAANPNWYLSEWNSSKLWLYDINPYSGSGSMSPSIIDATPGPAYGAVVSTIPIPTIGEDGTLPNGAPVFIPYGSTLTVNGNVGIAEGKAASSANPTTTYDWNVSTPWLNTMPLEPFTATMFGLLPNPPGTDPVTILAVNYGDMMFCINGSLPTGFGTTSAGYPQLPWTMFAVNLNSSRGAIGSILWMKTYNPPSGNITLEFGAVDWQTRVVVFSYEETIQWVGYSLTNGDLIWGPTTPEVAFDYYGTPGVSILIANLAYGNLYSSSFGGVCYCRNDLTGTLEWTWGNGPAGTTNSTNAGFTTPYGNYPTFIQSIANGVVYLATDEHTITDPIYKGSTLESINATTGQEIVGSVLSDYPSEWSSAGSSFVVADGYLTCMNGYDQQIYVLGRGPSATTVQAPQTSVTAGTNVVIQGTVMDTSTGTLQSEQKADFPNGVPVCSDASMTQWMGYVYQQQAEPANFTGVTVTLTAIDPNGNHVNIGSATTDEKGVFGYVWTPPNIAGKYTVTATFGGTNGYWGSNAETTMVVQSPVSTVAPTSTPSSVVNTYFVPSVIAIIIVIIIVGAILAILTLRKRP